MNGNFANVERIIRNSARALIGKIVDIGLPIVGHAIRGIKLACRKVLQCPFVQPSKRYVDWMSSKLWSHRSI